MPITTHVQLNAKAIEGPEPEGMALHNVNFERGTIWIIPAEKR